MVSQKTLNRLGWIFAIIVIDFVLWIIIGLILLNYGDNWDSTKGHYFSFEGMNITEKIAFISYYIWIVLNALILIYISYRLIKKYLLKK